MRKRLESALRRLWFEAPPTRTTRALRALLAPLAALTKRVAARQRTRIAALPAPKVPLVAIGNLIIGGAGKTPLVGAVAAALAARGWHPGLVASGYGAARRDARLVHGDDCAKDAGDEAVLLARLTGLPLAVGRRRAAAVTALLNAHPEIDVVISDDGLQHAALARTLEIAVFDRRGVGNGRLLPAGPLREPLEHLAGMDAIAINGDAPSPLGEQGDGAPRVFCFRVVPHQFVRVDERAEPLGLDAFRELVQQSSSDAGAGPASSSGAGASLTAVAGIGEPQRLFDTLVQLGLPPALRVAPGDHRTLDASTLAALPGRFVVMTTKDAVKCRVWADARCWALEVCAEPEPDFIDWLEDELREATRLGLPPA